MTSREIFCLGKLWQDRLGLNDWKIEFPLDDELKKYWADEGFPKAHASCWRSKHYREAKIYVNPDDYRGWSYKEGQEHIVHELVHCLLVDVEFTMDMIDQHMPKDVMEMTADVFTHHVERAVDNIAKLFIRAWVGEDVSG